VFLRSEIALQTDKWHQEHKKIVFTNGCFDILHRGHVEYLNAARNLGDVLVIGVNTDASVSQIKGPERPLVNQDDRSFLLAQLVAVDAVVLFSEDTPYNLINEIKPDVLVKGGDYKESDVVGRDIVEDSGGKVVIIPLVKGKSTTGIIEKIRNSLKQKS
jgi:D-beta-D-heptose 7-phosphate kinase/D-beta-D-heptose 1-phosphate adenosyltransferase